MATIRRLTVDEHYRDIDMVESMKRGRPDPFYVRAVGQVGHVDNGRKNLRGPYTAWPRIRIGPSRYLWPKI